MILFGDLETFSATPITHGTYRYAQDAEVMLFLYAIDEGPVECWDVTTGEPMPGDLEYLLLDESVEIVFQNSMFDRSVFRLAANSHPAMRAAGEQLHRWRDSMVKALAHALPGALAKTGEIMGLPDDQQKSKDGRALINLFCKPRPVKQKLRRASRDSHPQEWDKFIVYGKNDVVAMREVWRKLPSWNYTGGELALWHLDQKINDRGFAVDLDLVRAALAAVADEQARLAARAVDLTNGEVASTTQRDAMLLHILAEHGIALPDLKASTVEGLLSGGYHGAGDLPPVLAELLAVRLDATTTSTSKYAALDRAVNDDGRMRGTLQFDGAGRTHRWAGRTFQPQNLPSRGLLPSKDLEEGIELLKAGDVELIGMTWGVMPTVSSAIRGCIVAPKDKKLVVADLANIEGRGLAWLAGETWKLQAFRDYDDGTGADLYKLAYAKAFGIRVDDVDKPMRQIGKVMELMLGYQGGVGAYITGALTYRIDLETMARDAWETLPDDLKREAREFLLWMQKKNANTFGLSDEVFITCDVFKRGWRNGHPMIASWWKELEAAAIYATEAPGRTIECRSVKFRRDGAWLRLVLPSGVALCYPQPRVDDDRLSYMGVNQYSRKWCRLHTYGGKLAENATQGFARDILAYNADFAERDR